MDEAALVTKTISVWDFCAIVAVSAIWGGTNPFLRKGAQHAHANSRNECKYKILKPLVDLKNYAMDWRFSVPFVLNQSGSVLYVALLAHMPMSVVVPTVNTLTLVATAVVGNLLGEKPIGRGTLVGTAFIIAGVALIVAA